ncbi:probable ATP-dependent RNA helicase spindle-E [Varroa jacobsoni]|uniref:probable ATP-dependent RNA helicase spindle-E n=1 Tax=Varroa jacobsoni TaxID=62625 RepID=UPI000BF3B9F8|nr:probable ATP-dependent RNA helicase spindle-E [Varroa jacobsoni]XP_022706187.1 probable ATP-dependent RNA helicase spindle-E [Varroa jacobsoni]
MEKVDAEKDKLRLEAARLTEKYFSDELNLPKKKNLPVVRSWSTILQSINNKPVTIVIGTTGCGKTTQVPQLMLEEKLFRQGQFCRIAVTQPRRIAAISVAETVCRERHWKCGTICGYQVGMDRFISEDSCIQYMTTNVLVEKIIHKGNLETFTHIIVDEIHERHQDLDCLLYLLKSLSDKMENEGKMVPKLILMSATAEWTIYANYFNLSRVDVVHVSGEVHRVQKIYLDDLPPKLSQELRPLIVVDKLRNESGDSSKEYIKPGASRAQFRAVTQLISSLNASEDAEGTSNRGAVLIFLPGVSDIKAMIKCFDETRENRLLLLIALHSRAPLDNQNRIFQEAPAGKRKVIVATNIAESSITVPDIRYVIDFCLTKNQVVDRNSGFASYQVEFCSRASCDQRAGRAGRVQNGVVYRLLSRHDYEMLPEFSEPEILRSPVDITVLKIKKFGLNKPKQVLAGFISPPRSEDVGRAIIKLKEVQALQLEHEGKVDLDDGDLTIMGRVMASLPLDVRLSKLILMGFAFDCFEECVKMAACMSVDDLLTPVDDPMERYKGKLDWAEGHYSDPLLLLNVFDEYLTYKESSGPAFGTYASKEWARKRGLEARRLAEAFALYEELKERLLRIGFSKPQGPNRKPRESSTHNFLIMTALCGAFYPHYYVQKDIDSDKVLSEVGFNNPSTTMVIRNMPPEYGQLYCQAIRIRLQDCLNDDEVEFHFKGSDVYLLFKNHDINQVPRSMYLCQKYYLLHRRLELPRIHEPEAKRLLNQVGRPMDEKSGQSNDVGVVVVSREVEQLPRLQKASWPLKSHFKGTISWWNEENAFQGYLQLEERMKQLKDIVTEIHNEFGTRKASPTVVTKPQVGMIVLAAYQGILFRSRIVTISSDGITVFFIDYGNTSKVGINQVYVLPLSMLLCSHEAPFAYEFQLANVHSLDGKPVKPTGFQKLLINKPCRVELYSIVDNVFRVDIFVESDEEIHINEQLRYDRIAVFLDEPQISSQIHELEDHGVNFANSDCCVIKGEVYTDPNQCSSDIEIIGSPCSPLAKSCSLDTLKRNHHVKDIYVNEQSVNQVMFGEIGVQRRFIVAHSERLSSDKRLQLLRTTLMPKLNMMLPFVALVFSPRAEYRCSDNQTAYIRAICGLGAVENEDGIVESVCPESDIDVPFSHELGRTDVKIINRIRSLLNEAFCGNNQFLEWASLPILRIQDKLVQEILKFINNKNRQCLTPDLKNEPEYRFQWSKAFKRYDAQDHSSRRQALFRPHCAVPIRTKQMFELLTQTHDFMEAAKGVDQIQILMCPICIKVFGNRRDAREHMAKEEHRIQYKKLRGKSDFDEELGGKESTR